MRPDLRLKRTLRDQSARFAFTPLALHLQRGIRRSHGLHFSHHMSKGAACAAVAIVAGAGADLATASLQLGVAPALRRAFVSAQLGRRAPPRVDAAADGVVTLRFWRRWWRAQIGSCSKVGDKVLDAKALPSPSTCGQWRARAAVIGARVDQTHKLPLVALSTWARESAAHQLMWPLFIGEDRV